MQTILVATEKPFAKVAVDGIREIVKNAGFELKLLEKYTSREQLLEAVKDVEAIIFRSDIIDEQVIESAKKLKIAVRAGAGYDNIDLKAASAKGVVVMNTPGQNSNAVAELAFGMMIYINRNFYNGSSGVELRGKTLGIHAYGNIGRIVGMIAKGMGMDVYAHDPFVDKVIIENDGIKYVNDVKDLYRKCQYISVNLPANKETRESLNYDLLSLMPAGATLVNTARKEIVHEPSLLKLFAERKDFRYVTDVAPDCQEQIKAEAPNRYYATPKKMGAQTEEANVNAGLAAARQIVGFLTKGDKTFQVN
ncbi:MAG: 3-phosphoglycerate dehydrogenase [Bacteroidales bacterium]|nr:3-phosphoglycerate dehydrogenase [Bacteroidales bacterium]